MDTKYKVIIATVSLATAFAIGRYTVPEKIKTVEVEKKVTDEKTDTNKHTETTVVIVKKPDGTTETTKKTVSDTNKKTDEKTVVDDKKQSDIVKNSSRLNVSALGGMQLNSGLLKPTFGAHISKDLIGPISVGLWGMSNLSAGVSVGLTF